MAATSLDLSQIKTDALSAASTFRTLIGLGTSDTPTFKAATLSTGTITTSTPAIDITQTWNNNAVAFTGIKFNVTDTASSGSSLLFDLQYGGISRFKVQKGGNAFFSIGSMTYWNSFDNSYTIAQATSNGGLGISGSDVVLIRDAANTLAQRNDTSAQALRIYKTYSGGGTNFERGVLDWQTIPGIFRIGTENSGTGVTRNIVFVGGNVGIGNADWSTVVVTNPLTVISNVVDVGYFKNSAGPTNFTVEGLNTNNSAAISFKAGGTQYWQFGKGIGDGSANFYIWDNVLVGAALTAQSNTGRIGIGLTSPAAKLDILDTTGAGSGSLQASALNIAQTWNTTGTPTAFKLNVTEVQSNAASLLMDLQVGGSSKFKVSKAGILSGPKNNGFLTTVADSTGSGSVSAPIYGAVGGPCLWIGDVLGISNGFLFSRGAVNPEIGVGSSTLVVGSAHSFAWASSSSVSVNAPADLTLFRDAANTLAQRNGTSAQALRIYNTTDAGLTNYERAKIAWESNTLRIGTEKLGTGSARALELQTDGTTRLTIATNGNLTGAALTLDNSNSQNIGLDVRPWITIKNNSATLAGYLSNGGSIFSSGASGTTDLGLRAVGAFGISVNNSVTPTITISSAALVTLADASNLSVGTTTGTKIGTATTQKLGFYNATPVVQPAAVADATDAASVITQLNLLLARMRDLGLIAT